MTTFFPHLYEYGRIVNFLKERDKRNSDKCHKRKSPVGPDNLPTTEVLTKISPNYNQYHQSKDIDFLVYLELKAQKLRESTYNPVKLVFGTIETILKEKTELSNANNYEKPSEWPLNEIALSGQFRYPREVMGKHWSIIDFILCIEFAKILPFFSNLNVYDQQAALRETILLNASFTQAYYSFLVSCDAIIFPDGSMPIKRPIVHIYQKEIFERIVEPIKRIQMTKEEYILLKTIMFCSSKSSTISDGGRHILETEFHKYSRLLLNHIQAKWGDAAGAVRYSQILSVMEAMIYFAQKGKEFYIFLGTLRPDSPHALSLVDQIIVQS